MIKPDNALDDIERAHLVDPRESFYAIDRFAAPPDLSELARRHWIPVWDLPEGESSTQEVLQYPVCLIVISNSYARFYGVQSGLSRTTLSGTGWASGVMLQPAAGSLVLGGDVRTMTDRFVDAREILDGALVAAVRSAMADPNDPECRRASAAVLDDALRAWLPVDEEGLLVARPRCAHISSASGCSGAGSGSVPGGSSNGAGCTRRANGCGPAPGTSRELRTISDMPTRLTSPATSEESPG